MSSVPDVESIIVRVENESDDDAESIITNERYNYITSIIGKCYVKKNKSGLTTSDKIDKSCHKQIFSFANIRCCYVYSILCICINSWRMGNLIGLNDVFAAEAQGRSCNYA